MQVVAFGERIGRSQHTHRGAGFHRIPRLVQQLLVVLVNGYKVVGVLDYQRIQSVNTTVPSRTDITMLPAGAVTSTQGCNTRSKPRDTTPFTGE